ncbi:Major facilitator superfamily permease [Ignavibacterium album JCM 16511]|uniref:Major facilitator superfamily permease n=1 Tax=Ignavibacterium album (strain DSM 19864 / JCM 16511 / NBRC 101810 / Mat9-16) TaxID=945713 RepID=I0AKD9_IGNAJ|nr:MFS transporter [Ignavibacterium album]AFH49446.1 Major facilitator superfamily permease [Ignavibacterium album JCM 16511]
MLEIQKKLTNIFYALLALPATAMGFALSIQISALSWILSTKYKLDIHDVGLVWAAGPIAGILGQVIIGIISDNVWFLNGRRRPFILIGGFLAAMMLLALPNIDVISSALGIDGILGVAIAVALTLDLAINISFNPTRSIIADVTPEGVERTKGYTWMQTISGTFGVLAYVIGAVWNNYVLIYFGVFLVLVLSIVPTLFIEEPRYLSKGANQQDKHETKASFGAILGYIEPLWGFLIYSIYAILMRVLNIHFENYYAEIICFVITIVFILKVLLQKSETKSAAEKGLIGFKKVLAAHSFTWVGIQTMFVYMFAYVQYKVFGYDANSVIPEDVSIQMGKVVTISFLIFNAVAAVLPVLVLEPMARKIGKVRTHFLSIASMAIAYAAMLFFGFSPLVIYIIMALLGIGWASTISLPFAIMSQQIDQTRMGLFMGLFNLSVVLPQLVASFGIGQAISAAQDKSLIFIISAVTLSISAILWMLVKEEKVHTETN